MSSTSYSTPVPLWSMRMPCTESSPSEVDAWLLTLVRCGLIAGAWKDPEDVWLVQRERNSLPEALTNSTAALAFIADRQRELREQEAAGGRR